MNISAARFTPNGMTVSFMNRTADPRHDGATMYWPSLADKNLIRHAQIRSN